jgi:hypothetical protein
MTHETAIIAPPVALLLGSLRMPPTTNKQGTMAAPHQTSNGRRPTFSVAQKLNATNAHRTELTATVAMKG